MFSIFFYPKKPLTNIELLVIYFNIGFHLKKCNITTHFFSFLIFNILEIKKTENPKKYRVNYLFCCQPINDKKIIWIFRAGFSVTHFFQKVF